MEQKLTVLLLLTVFLTVFNAEAKYSGPQGRITGGGKAKKGAAPYMVSIQTRWGHFCGGAIVDERWIATAAHCVVNKYANDVYIFTGKQDLAKSNEAVYYYVDRMYVHCNYDEPRQANDVALLHLNDTIEMNDETSIIPFSIEPLVEGETVTLTGWGQETQYGEIVDELKSIDLKYMPYKECKAAHNNSEEVYIGHICTFTKRGEGSCIHDSGGPLANENGLVGIVNWGEPCAVGLPDVFGSVSYHYNWFRTIMSSDGECDGNCKCNAFIKENRKRRS